MISHSELSRYPPPVSESLQSGTSPVNPAGVFVTTHWSVVRAAGRSDTTRGRVALEQLCAGYWHPLYYYVRRRGYSPEDSQDLTQEFFARLLQRKSLALADPDRGRFRSFLLSALKNFLTDEWDKAHALKRGGGQVLSLDFHGEEERFQADHIDYLTPEKAFERRWAISLLEQVYSQLENEARAAGKAEQFAVFRSALMGGRGSVPHAELGAKAGLTEGAARVAVHRLRQRYRELLRAAIAETVCNSAEVEAELKYLLQVLSN